MTHKVQKPSRSAAKDWAQSLGAWDIPPDILARATRSPWEHAVSRFVRRADDAVAEQTPATDFAIRTLTQPADVPGSVLDVGCGAGAATAPLLSVAGQVTGVDEKPDMLKAFMQRADHAGVPAHGIHGRWPDVADQVEVADVVVCHDVLYNVPDAEEFLARLTDHARRHVVVVVPDTHPQAWTAPYWRELHGIERPDRPTAADLVAVIQELGYRLEQVQMPQRTWWAFATDDDLVDTVMRRLCLPPERQSDARAAVARYGVPAQRIAWVLSWPGSGPEGQW